MNRKNIILQAIYRIVPVIFVIFIGLIGLNNGIYFKDIPDIGDESFVVQLYYIVSLFLMSGIDFGLPIGESDFYRLLVLTAWLFAPIIAATSVIEAIFRSVDPNFFQRKYKDHIVIIGASKLAVSRVNYLKELKEKIIIVDNNSDNVNLEYFKKLNNIIFIIEDYKSPNILEKLNIDACKSIWLFTDDDFLNIELALKIKNTYVNFNIGNIDVRCESRALYSDLRLHPEKKKYFKRMRKDLGEAYNSFHVISNNQTLANIFYYKFFYQLRDADNLVIYGCNEFTDALLQVLNSARRIKRGEESQSPFKIKKIILIDDNEDLIKRKQDKQAIAPSFKEYTIEYIFSEINNDTTHEGIARELPLLDCTKYLLLKDDFHLNSKLASGIITTINYQRPFSQYFIFGNPADKLIYRGEATDFDSMISINSKDLKGGGFYKKQDKLFLESLTENGKSDTFKDVYCFNEQHEIKNAENTYHQIEIDDEFEIPKRGVHIRLIEAVDYIKNDINTRIVEYSILHPRNPKTIYNLKQEYEMTKESDWGRDYLLFNDNKAEDRKALESLFKTLINEENE